MMVDGFFRVGLNNVLYLLLLLLNFFAMETGFARGGTPSPTPPTSISVASTNYNGSFSISWSGGSNASSYRLYESVNGGSYVYLYSGASSSYSRSGRVSGTYRYQAYNCNAAGCASPITSSVLTVVLSPSSLSTSTTLSTDGSFSTNWPAVSGNLSRYEYRESSNGGSSYGGWVSNGMTQSKGWSGKTTAAYRYQVRACVSSTCGNYVSSAIVNVVRTPASVSVQSTVSTDGSLSISWPAVSGSTGYQYRESTNGGSTYGGWVSNSMTRNKSWSGKTTGAYRYQVRACYSSVCGNYASSEVIHVVLSPASVDAAATVSTNGSISISWPSVSGSTGYQYRESTNGGSSYGSVVSHGTSRNKSWPEKTTGAYRYQVRACYSSVCGNFATSPVITVVRTPSSVNVGASVSRDGAISINWPSVSGSTGYQYRESTDGGTGYGGWQSNGTGLTKSWTGKGNAVYRYQVRACYSSTCGNHETSSQITVVRTPAAPGAISFTPPSLACDSTPNITWGAATGGSHYDLEYKIDNGGWTLLNLAMTQLGRSHDVSAGHHYQYRVRARYHLNGHDSHYSGYTTSSTIRKPHCAPINTLGVDNVALGLDGKYHIGYDGVYTIEWSSSGVVTSETLQELEPGGAWTTLTPAAAAGSMTFDKTDNYGIGPIDYQYRIQACNEDACNNWQTMTVRVLKFPKPSAPGDMSVIDGPHTNGAYRLAWGASTGPTVTHYHLRRDNETPIRTEPDITAYQFTDGVSGQTYLHYIEACNTDDACSDEIAAFAVKIPYEIPGAVNTIDGPERVRGGNYTLAWDAATGPVAYYQLEQTHNGQVINLNTGLNQYYDFNNQVTGEYRYRVRACNPDDQCPEFSQVLTVRVSNITAPNLSSVSVAPETHHGVVFNGGIQGQESVSQNGAAHYNIPISLPPATAGMAPTLSLSYSSQTGSRGWLGLGWSLNGVASGISRCAQTLAQDGRKHNVDLTADDRFCLDGARLLAVTGNYAAVGSEYRTEINQFANVISHGGVNGDPQYFTVRTANGKRLSFGASTDSRIEAQGNTQAMIWLLNKVEDRLGNYYTVHYAEDHANGSYRPDKIEYTGNSSQSLTPYNTVQFEYESRNDVIARYLAGSKTQTLKRLAHIKTYAGSTLVKDYQLNYQEHGPIQRSQLDSIRVCGRDDNQAEACSETTHFTWTSITQGWSLAAYEPPDDLYEFFVPGTLDRISLIDFDGDGLLDMGQKKGTNQSSFINNGQGWDNDTNYIYPDTIDLGADNRDKGIRLVDFNADGLPDIVRAFRVETSTPVYDAWRNTGSGWVVEPSNGYIPPDYITNYIRQEGTNVGARVIDVNGDHLPDFLVSRPNEIPQTWLNSGTSWETSQDYTMPVEFFASFNSATKHEVKMRDLNGDGLADIIYGRQANDGTPSSFPERVWINNGVDGWNEETSSTPTSYRNALSANPQNLRFADLNGDGLIDMLHHHDDNDSATTDTATAHLNTGNGWVSASGFTPPSVLTHQHDPALAVALKDVNGDGLPDYLNGRPNSRQVWLNTGSAWQLSSAYALPSQTVEGGLKGQLEDVNGDGIVDLLRNTSTTIPAYTKAVWENQSKKIRLEKVIDGLGNEIEYIYKPLTDASVYTKGSLPHYPAMALQDSRDVVAELKSGNGIGGQRVQNHHYIGLKTHLKRAQSLGFTRTIKTDTLAKQKTATEYGQVFPEIGLIKKVKIRSTYDGRLLKRIENTYTSLPPSAQETLYQYLHRRVETQYEPATARQLSQSIETYENPDAYGNLQSITREVSDTIHATTHKSKTTRQYENDSTNWHLRRLKHELIEKYLDGVNDAEKNRLMDFTYYPNGLLQTRIQEQGQGAPYEMTSTYTYDGFGNLATETVSGPDMTTRKTTDIQYDARGQFPRSIENALQHSQSVEYDDRFGTLKRHSDANGLLTLQEVDAFGRIRKTTRPDGIISETVYYTSSAITHAVFYRSTTQTGSPASRTYYDSLGRPLRLRSQGYDGRYIYQDTEYDARGYSKTSQPYFEDELPLWNTATYDDYNRLSSNTPADSSKNNTINYDGLTVTATDAAGNTSSRTQNALGWLIAASDANGTLIHYEHDAWGRTEVVSNAAGTALASVVSIEYDRLGRKTELIDPNAGHISYRYNNALSERLTEVTPRMRANAQSKLSIKDKLGRLIERQEPEGTTTWQWDHTAQGNLGLGRLYQESQNDFIRTYQFDATDKGRLSRTTTQIGNESFTIHQRYNNTGRLDQLTYPASPGYSSGLTVRYHYTALGHLERVSDANDTTHVYYQVLDRDASGRLTDDWSGDGSTTARLYAQASGRLDTLLSTDHQQNTLQSQKYYYDNLGRMTQRKDNRLGLSESFGFDNLHRVTSATVGTQITSYSYDAIGNLIEKSDIGTLKYGNQCTPPGGTTNPGPHAVCEKRASDNTILDRYQYDENGNLTEDNNRSLQWTSYNKVKHVVQGTIDRTFDYGPDRRRYRQTHTDSQQTTTTLYIQGLYERISDNANTRHRHYIQAGGRTIAIQTTGSHQNAIHYLHKDHLGSSTTLTDELGDIVERSSYDVWGKRRNAQTWLADTPNAEEVRGYTGHEHLDDQNLIHMNGRVYDPTIARMLSVDPIVADTTNLQTWNRYSYVMNNSLRYIDPSGFGPESSSTETCQSEDGKPCEILVSVYHSSNGGGSFGYGYGTTGSQYWFGGGAANISQGAGGGGSANISQGADGGGPANAQAGTSNDGDDADQRSNLEQTSSKSEPTLQGSIGAGGSIFALVAGLSAESGVVIDSTGQVCGYTQTCVLAGVGIFGDLEIAPGISYSETPLSSGTSQTLGFFIKGGFRIVGGLSVSTTIVDDPSSDQVVSGASGVKSVIGTGGGAAAGFQVCTVKVYCGD